jgi:hypothetical protein
MYRRSCINAGNKANHALVETITVAIRCLPVRGTSLGGQPLQLYGINSEPERVGDVTNINN